VKVDYRRALLAEALGTAFLLATVVGSGIMAQTLADGNSALALLGNTLPTGAILVVLILMFGPVSGGHFNPAISLVFWLRHELSSRQFIYYVTAQVTGATLGVLIAHAMFELPLVSFSETTRTGIGQFISEVVATFGLAAAILATLRHGITVVAAAVGLYISAGYWFTASTSFANPAVTIARGLTDSFSGIRLMDVPLFVIAQLAGGVLALLIIGWMLKTKHE
jgi:glycerol uptake facilitator-like aquaporin